MSNRSEKRTKKKDVATPVSSERTPARPPALNVRAAAAAVAGAAVVLAAVLFITMRNPSVVLLLPEGGADWIKGAMPASLNTQLPAPLETTFRKKFDLAEAVSAPVITVKFFRQGKLYLDEKEVYASAGDVPWNKAHAVTIDGEIPAGDHELLVVAGNSLGPPLVLAYSEQLGLATGKDWEVEKEGGGWDPAVLASEYELPEMSRQFQPAYVALLRFSPLYIAIVALTVVLHVPGLSRFRPRVPLPPARKLRFIPIILLAILGLNNLFKIPYFYGFDQQAHYEYIEYLANTGRIPLATEGAQMFQSPAYYLACAVLYRFLSVFFGSEIVLHMMALPSILCGILLCEASYRMLCRVFPGRDVLVFTGTCLAGFMPMNTYLSQTLTNEMLSSLLIAITLIMAFDIIHGTAVPLNMRRLSLLGLTTGLALLSKFTSVLLIPIGLAAAAWPELVRPGHPRKRVKAAATAITVMMVVVAGTAGWYYVRNYLNLGRFFIGGWDQSRGDYIWWQYPGYRTLSDFLRFGEVLRYPIQSGFRSFFDGFYSTMWADGMVGSILTLDVTKGAPPWNYGLMLSSVWLALLPVACILLGFVRCLVQPKKSARSGLVYCAVLVPYFTAALVAHVLTNPAYCAIKAFYLLGSLPALAVVFAAGFDWLTLNPRIRPVVYGLFACWCVAAYGSYFVL